MTAFLDELRDSTLPGDTNRGLIPSSAPGFDPATTDPATTGLAVVSLSGTSPQLDAAAVTLR